MAPIATYTDSPITVAAKPEGVTPQTAPPASSSVSHPGNAPPATTTASVPSGYPPAQPGAAAPAPTGASSPYVPANVAPAPTRTTSPPSDDGPPPPQPSFRPVPPGFTDSSSARSPLPPPPKVGEKFVPPTPTTMQPGAPSYPPQMGIPPPAGTYPAQQTGTMPSSSSGAAAAYGPGPTNLGMQGYGTPQNLAHPPGYQQNASTQGLDRYQQSAMAVQPNSGSSNSGTGGGDQGDGILDMAKKWAWGAGEALAAAESEIWKRINKD